jgi:hypothetical protein
MKAGKELNVQGTTLASKNGNVAVHYRHEPVTVTAH